MDRFSPLQGDCDKGYIDWRGDSTPWPDLNGTFDARLLVPVSTVLPTDLELETYKCCGDAWISNQKVRIRSTRHPHKCAHLLEGLK